MAVTIHDEPQDYTPSGNPVVFTFSSDQTGQANFSYLVEVSVNGTVQGRQQVFPGNGINGRIDCTSYAERFTSAPAMSTDYQTSALNNATIQINVFERFGDPIADGANTLSSTINVFKSRLSDVDFINWDHQEYLLDSNGAKFMSTHPTDENVLVGNDEQFKLMSMSGTNVDFIYVELFDSGGGTIADDLIAVTAAEFVIFSLGPQSIITNTSITQANFDAAATYIIQVQDSGSIITGETFTVTIDRRCNRDTAKRLHFISALGSMESFTYTLYSNETGTIATHRYEKEFGNWNGSSFEFNLNSGRVLDYQKRNKKELLLRSNWLTESIQNWLEAEVGLSPFTFIEDSDDANLGLRRVAISKNRFIIKTTKQNTQFREDLTLIIDTHTSMSL